MEMSFQPNDVIEAFRGLYPQEFDRVVLILTNEQLQRAHAEQAKRIAELEARLGGDQDVPEGDN